MPSPGTPVFKRSSAVRDGMVPWALETLGYTSLTYGYYSRSADEVTALDVARAVVRETPRSFVSHQSAALAHGIVIPVGIDSGVPCVSRARGTRALRLPGVRSCSVKVVDLDTVELLGVPTSTPARIFLELARELSHDDLVALGDQLVRIPRMRYDGREHPYSTLMALDEMLRAHPRSPNARFARAALRDVRVGADSVPETKMRLAILQAGFPEPSLQVPLDPNRPEGWSSDLGYPSLGIAAQYDGDPHLDPDQQHRDNQRDGAFSSAGWIVIKANRRDLANGFARIIAELRQAFVTRGVRAIPEPSR